MLLRCDEAIEDLLQRSRTIAVVGASPDPSRPSNDVFRYLRSQPGLEVGAINPRAAQIGGVPSYASLDAYCRDHASPDIVDVFRARAHVFEPTREAIAVGARAIWFQLGVASQEAIDLAERAGLVVVAEHCIKVELRALRRRSSARTS
jgi:predicted CoA-binding protein